MRHLFAVLMATLVCLVASNARANTSHLVFLPETGDACCANNWHAATDHSAGTCPGAGSPTYLCVNDEVRASPGADPAMHDYNSISSWSNGDPNGCSFSGGVGCYQFYRVASLQSQIPLSQYNSIVSVDNVYFFITTRYLSVSAKRIKPSFDGVDWGTPLAPSGGPGVSQTFLWGTATNPTSGAAWKKTDFGTNNHSWGYENADPIINGSGEIDVSMFTVYVAYTTNP